MEWFRWYHGSVSDPKFRLLAKLADAKLTEVLAVWQSMLEHASQSSPRGSLDGWRDDVTAVCLDMDANAVERIRTQANHVGLIANADDGIEFLASWDKRQPKREDGSAERAKAWREQKKFNANADERLRTQKNTEQNRTEQNREEENTSSLRPEAVQLAERLAARILETNPKAKTGEAKAWAKHVDLMLRIDKRTAEEVAEVIDWCQRDSFWCSNILSTKKLREKFDQLTAKMNGQGRRQDRSALWAGAL
jgi:hypothetical protein